MWMLLAAGVAQAGCGLTDLESALSAVETSYVDMASDFVERAAAVHEQAACLDAPITPQLAQRVHRAVALEAFVTNDSATLNTSLARWRSLDARATLEDRYAPGAHPLRDAFDAANTAPEWVELGAPAQGWLLVDGDQTVRVPGNLPYVFQLLDDEGTVQRSALVAADAQAPGFPKKKDLPAPADAGENEPRQRRALNTLTIIGISGLGVGALTYGGAVVSRAGYDRAVESGDADAIRARHRTTNVLSVTGTGLLLAGAGVTVAGVF